MNLFFELAITFLLKMVIWTSNNWRALKKHYSSVFWDVKQNKCRNIAYLDSLTWTQNQSTTQQHVQIRMENERVHKMESKLNHRMFLAFNFNITRRLCCLELWQLLSPSAYCFDKVSPWAFFSFFFLFCLGFFTSSRISQSKTDSYYTMQERSYREWIEVEVEKLTC